jgi:AcrR family transcriptional regulator
MYHIKNDKRAQKSAELICAGLMKCLEDRPFDEITVTDVQRASTVSRSTFYRSFDSLSDVLELMCDRGFDEIFGKSAEQGVNPELREEVFDYWFTNSRVPEALVRIHRTDIFLNSFRRCALKLDSMRSLASEGGRYDYFVSMIVGVMVGVLVTWIEHGKTESREEVRGIIQDEFDMISMLGIMG